MKDLHLHLSSGTSTRVLWEIIKNSGYKTGIKSFFEFTNFVSLIDKGELDSYLDTLHWIDKAQSSPDAMLKCVYDSFVSSAVNGCTYLELRMNITKRSQNGAIDLDSLIVSARAGMEKARMNFGILGKIILCCGRDCSTEANKAVIDKVIKYKDRGVAGIDIAGHYKWPWKDMELYEHAYKMINEKDMITTVHCGEIEHDDIEEEIEWVLTKLKPKRLGHGIGIVKFPRLMKIARENDVMLEICMSSNIATGAVKSYDDFKNIFSILNKENIKYQLCTDATYLINTNIKREYELYASIMGSKPPEYL